MRIILFGILISILLVTISTENVKLTNGDNSHRDRVLKSYKGYLFTDENIVSYLSTFCQGLSARILFELLFGLAINVLCTLYLYNVQCVHKRKNLD